MAYSTEPQAAKPITASSALEQFDPVLSRLADLVGKITNCADRVSGSRPSPVEGAKDAPTPQHLIAQIQERRQRLVALVDHLEGEVARLDSGIS